MMQRMGRKLVSLDDGLLGHWCPACGRPHVVRVQGHDAHERWAWNGDPDRPSLTPSIRVRRLRGRRESICHYVLREGVLLYLADSSHIMIGRFVPLPDFPFHQLEP